MVQDVLYDIAIIGAGPAGMMAAIYAARAGKKVIIFDKDGFGGNIVRSPLVENLPGFTSISGVDFASNLFNQMNACGDSVLHVIDEVKLINYQNKIFKIYTEHYTFCSLTTILATGTTHKELKLNTKDVYYCSTCDGPMFKKKNVLVVGSGNSGAAFALDLAQYCKTVYICDVTDNLCCENAVKNKLLSKANVVWLQAVSIAEVTNNKEGKLTKVKLTNNTEIKCSAIFAAIGQKPNTESFSNITAMNKNGFIVNENGSTVIEALFVAGDCRENEIKQVATAVGDGATCAIKAIKYLNTL